MTIKLTLDLQDELRRLGVADKLFRALADWLESEVNPLEKRIAELEKERDKWKERFEALRGYIVGEEEPKP